MSSPRTDEKTVGGEEAELRRRIFPILFLTSLFFLNFFSRILLSPLLPTIEADLQIDHAAAGSLFLFIASGFFVTLPLTGFVTARIRHRRAISLSAVTLGGAMIAVGSAQGLATTRVILFFLGAFAALYIPSGISTVTGLVSKRHWGKAISLHELAPNSSFVLAPVVTELLLAFFGWRQIFRIVGGLSILGGILFALFGKGGNFHGEAPAFHRLKQLLKRPDFLTVIFLFCLGIACTLGIYAMLPLYLVSTHGITRSTANYLLSASRVTAVGTSLISGFVADRFGPKRTLRIVLFVTGVLTLLLGVVPTPALYVVVFLQPMITSCFFPSALSILSAIGTNASRNLVVSITLPTAFLVGGGLIPTILGGFGDAGSFETGFILVGALIFIGALAVSRVGGVREPL